MCRVFNNNSRFLAVILFMVSFLLTDLVHLCGQLAEPAPRVRTGSELQSKRFIINNDQKKCDEAKNTSPLPVDH